MTDIPEPESSGKLVTINDPNDCVDDARNNIRDALDVINPTFKELSQFARVAQDARIMNSLSEMLNAITSANKTLAEIKSVVPPNVPQGPVVHGDQTTNVFYGTPADMLEALEKKKK